MNIISSRISSKLLNQQVNNPVKLDWSNPDQYFRQTLPQKAAQQISPLSKQSIDSKKEKALKEQKKLSLTTREVQTDNTLDLSPINQNSSFLNSLKELGSLTADSSALQAQQQQEQTYLQKVKRKTEVLLEDLSRIKGQQSEFEKIENLEEAIRFKDEMNKQLEQKLWELLYLILDDDSTEIDPLKAQDNLKRLMESCEQLQGKKTPDGQVKSKLFFQLLSEYKYLQLSKEQNESRKQYLTQQQKLHSGRKNYRQELIQTKEW